MFESRKQEKTFLIGVFSQDQQKWEAEESFQELKSLAHSTGSFQVGEAMASLRQITPSTYLGSGKIESLKSEISKNGANLVIFDGELSPTQNRNLEEAWGIKVVDRAGLILDIFALRAKSKEGKLQVELAQYHYLYPRLVGSWSHFSKQRGGVGLRGPGETQLEVDRRRVRERITWIKKELLKVDSSREIHRKKRESVPIPTVTLVGYTNAGKSTLFNALVDSDQLAEDKLFATLDPKTKRLKLPSGREVLLSDTVGFIRKLPHQLIEAFKSTFEEISGSDLLLHVVDASHPNCSRQMEIVHNVLRELELSHIPVLQVRNKVDMVGYEFGGNSRKVISISAQEGMGLSDLLRGVDTILSANNSFVRLFLPHPYGSLLSNLYSHGQVMKAQSKSKGVEVDVVLPEKWQRKLAPYMV